MVEGRFKTKQGKKIIICIIYIILFVMGCTQQKYASTHEGENLESSSGFSEVAATGVSYYKEGDGIPLLVISLTGTETYQKTFSQEIFQSFQVVIVNLGSQKRSITDITLDALMNDLEQLRKSLNLEKIAVFGHSGTVLLALEYAKRYPQSTSHLILIGAGPMWWGSDDYNKISTEYWDTSASDERKEILKHNREDLESEEFGEASPQDQFIMTLNAETPRYMYDPHSNFSFLFEHTALNIDVVFHVWNSVLKDYDQAQILTQISCPIFIAMGNYDFANPPSLWNGMCDQLKDCELNIFEKSGHFPMYEEQNQFDNKLIRWIQNK